MPFCKHAWDWVNRTNPIPKPKLSSGLPRLGGHQVGKTTGVGSSDSTFPQNVRARIALHLSSFRSWFPRQPHKQLRREDCRITGCSNHQARGEKAAVCKGPLCLIYTFTPFFSHISTGSYHTWSQPHLHDHLPDLLLGHLRKSTITDKAASLKIAGLGFLIIILFPPWEMSCTSHSVFFICRWFLHNCTIDPEMDRKPGSLSTVPEGVKASLDLWNSPGYNENLQSI